MWVGVRWLWGAEVAVPLVISPIMPALMHSSWEGVCSTSITLWPAPIACGRQHPGTSGHPDLSGLLWCPRPVACLQARMSLLHGNPAAGMPSLAGAFSVSPRMSVTMGVAPRPLRIFNSWIITSVRGGVLCGDTQFFDLDGVA